MTDDFAAEVLKVKATVDDNLPGLWPAVEAGLSVFATLFLSDNMNPVALIYQGAASSSKTTAAEMFIGHSLCYYTDNFTPAAFVSHAANRTEAQLKKVDLLPRIKHKLFVTPELAPIFRGDEKDLVNNFKIITRVLDGKGLMIDSGTHGQRGYSGDYMFAWLGATTPIAASVWRIMAQLGSRLFFLLMDADKDVTVHDLLAATRGTPFAVRHERCKAAVQAFLAALKKQWDEPRKVVWDVSGDSEAILRQIAQLATLVAAMRCDGRSGDEEDGEVLFHREKPFRANAVLYNLARGHALMHGRTQLTEEDLPLVGKVSASTMPINAGRVFQALVRAKGEPLCVSEVQKAIRMKHPDTARHAILELAGRGVANFKEHGQGVAATIQFHPEWEWCASEEARRLLWSQLVTEKEVCASPATQDLAQLRREEEGGEKEENTHTSETVISEVEGQTIGDPTAGEDYFNDKDLANPEPPRRGARYYWVVEELSPLAPAA